LKIEISDHDIPQASGGLTMKDPFKALTVKVDKKRYLALKKLGLDTDRSSQEVMVRALDCYLAISKGLVFESHPSK